MTELKMSKFLAEIESDIKAVIHDHIEDRELRNTLNSAISGYFDGVEVV